MLGEPESYLWGDKTFTKRNLPATYLIMYPKGVSVGIMNGRVWELRSDQPGPGFAWRGKVRLGSSLEEVLAVLGQPAKSLIKRPFGQRRCHPKRNPRDYLPTP